MIRTSIVLLATAAAALFVGTSPVIPASAASVFTIYMSPNGSDANSGLSRTAPIHSLARAEAILRATRPATDVVVDIRQGSYTEAQTEWSFYIPGHTISFMADGSVLGGGRPAAGDPVFTSPSTNGVHPGAWWFHARLPSSSSQSLYSGGTTGLRFYYLRVRDYTGGISFDGQSGRTFSDGTWYIKPSDGIDGNTVFGMSFEQIGNAYTNANWGYGAILFTDSSNNDIENNSFDQVANVTGPAIHDLYVTHFSSLNTVARNTFTTVNSEAIKVRDRSNFNDVDSNTFNDTGGASAYRDEFCDSSCVQANPGTQRQCASYDNTFDNNIIGTVYGGSSKQAAWTLSPAGQTNAGGGICAIPSGLQRLYASGNV